METIGGACQFLAKECPPVLNARSACAMQGKAPRHVRGWIPRGSHIHIYIYIYMHAYIRVAYIHAYMRKYMYYKYHKCMHDIRQ